MFDINKIKSIIDEVVKGEEAFVVDVVVKPGNNIHLYVDKLKGLSIGDCVTISRKIESNFDRDAEDFELNVSSPGIDEPYKVFLQYVKNVGRKVEVTTIDNQIISGELVLADETGIEIKTIKKEKINNKKQIITNNIKLNYNQIKQTKTIIIF